MYIKSLKIENIKAFEKVELDFERPGAEDRTDAEKFAGLNVFVGGNASGKTTLLRCIVLAVAGSRVSAHLIVSPQDWIRARDDTKGRITVNTLHGDLSLTFSSDIKSKGSIPEGMLICAYGPMRRLTGNSARGAEFTNRRGILASCATLFFEDTALEAADQWLKDEFARELDTENPLPIRLESHNITRESATTLHQKAEILEKQSNLHEAINHYQQALRIRSKVLGETHRETILTMERLAECYRLNGLPEESLSRQRRVLRIKIEKFGHNNKEVGITLNHVALSHLDLEQFDEAETLFIQSISIIRAESRNPNLESQILRNMGDLYRQKGDYETSLSFLDQSMEIQIRLFGENSVQVTGTINLIAHLKVAEGKYDEALDIQRRILAIRIQHLGIAHQDVAKTFVNIGNIYRRMGKYQDAILAIEQALTIFEQASGETSNQTIRTINNLAKAYQEMGDMDKSYSLLDTAEKRQHILTSNGNLIPNNPVNAITQVSFTSAVCDFLNNGLLPTDFTVKRITVDEVFASTPHGEMPLGDMSDGYRITYALILDIIRHMVDHYKTKDIFETNEEGLMYVNKEGVVLIDELEAHLHPSWQRTICKWLKERFPKVQFFITTHSPLVAQAADEGGVFVLPMPDEIAAGSSTVRRLNPEEQDRVRYGDADRVLLGDAFGLDYTWSEYVQKQIERWEELSGLLYEGIELTKEELDEHGKLKHRLAITFGNEALLRNRENA